MIFIRNEGHGKGVAMPAQQMADLCCKVVMAAGGNQSLVFFILSLLQMEVRDDRLVAHGF